MWSYFICILPKLISNATRISFLAMYHAECALHYYDVMGRVASQITSLTIVYSMVYSDIK